jgi:hypothetical protein
MTSAGNVKITPAAIDDPRRTRLHDVVFEDRAAAE